MFIFFFNLTKVSLTRNLFRCVANQPLFCGKSPSWRSWNNCMYCCKFTSVFCQQSNPVTRSLSVEGIKLTLHVWTDLKHDRKQFPLSLVQRWLYLCMCNWIASWLHKKKCGELGWPIVWLIKGWKTFFQFVYSDQTRPIIEVWYSAAYDIANRVISSNVVFLAIICVLHEICGS